MIDVKRLIRDSNYADTTYLKVLPMILDRVLDDVLAAPDPVDDEPDDSDVGDRWDGQS